jgi:hypothetical protein
VKPVAAALVSVAVTAALALPASAQAKCAPLSQSQALKVSDVVFEGVVGGHIGEGAEAKVTPGKPAQAGLRFRDFRFRVARYLLGEGGDNVAVRKALIPDSYPRADPRPGEAWRVYARRGPDGLTFSPCVPYSSRLDGAAAARVRERLSGGSATNGTDDGDTAGDRVPIRRLVLAVAVVAVALVAYLSRRRR